MNRINTVPLQQNSEPVTGDSGLVAFINESFALGAQQLAREVRNAFRGGSRRLIEVLPGQIIDCLDDQMPAQAFADLFDGYDAVIAGPDCVRLLPWNQIAQYGFQGKVVRYDRPTTSCGTEAIAKADELPSFQDCYISEVAQDLVGVLPSLSAIPSSEPLKVVLQCDQAVATKLVLAIFLAVSDRFRTVSVDLFVASGNVIQCSDELSASLLQDYDSRIQISRQEAGDIMAILESSFNGRVRHQKLLVQVGSSFGECIAASDIVVIESSCHDHLREQEYARQSKQIRAECCALLYDATSRIGDTVRQMISVGTGECGLVAIDNLMLRHQNLAMDRWALMCNGSYSGANRFRSLQRLPYRPKMSRAILGHIIESLPSI